MRKTLLFKIIAILFPFLFVLLLEVSLRIFSYGHSFDLFTEYPQTPGYLVFNPHASEKYFTNSQFAPVGNSEFFKKEKDLNTIRFFVLGESTTIGFPYFHNGSFHRWLLYRLMHAYPEKNFEIINLSLTAVNSYTIRGFAEELVNYEPEAVLIYVGQNEYYGGLGVASSQTIGGNPAIVNKLLKIRAFRIVQLLMNLHGKIAGLINNHNSKGEVTRMELMVGDQKIPYQSELYQKGINQFQYNINSTLATLNQNNIPVFFSNLVSNIKDLKPFISDDQENNNALDNYKKAQASYKEGDFQKAKEFFIKAKEKDLLRFRAPEELNAMIEEFCNQYPNTYFVDTKSELEKNTPHQILGNELFTDHVHPNLKGYALMANAFFKKINESQILPPSKIKTTEEQLLKEMPISPVDSLAGEFRIMTLKGHWPFYDSLYVNKPIPENTFEEKQAAKLFRNKEDWSTVHNALYTHYMASKQLRQAARIAEGSVLEYSEDPEFYEKAAMINGEIGNKKKAAFYFQKSFGFAPSFDKARYLFVLYLQMDKPQKSQPFLNYAIANNTRNMNLSSLKPLVDKIIQLKEKLQNEPGNVLVMNEIANMYLVMDNKDGAQKYVEHVLKIDEKNAEALGMMGKLNK